MQDVENSLEARANDAYTIYGLSKNGHNFKSVTTLHCWKSGMCRDKESQRANTPT